MKNTVWENIDFFLCRCFDNDYFILHTQMSPNFDSSILHTQMSPNLDNDSWSADTVVWMSDKTSDCCGCQQKFSYIRRRVSKIIIIANKATVIGDSARQDSS